MPSAFSVFRTAVPKKLRVQLDDALMEFLVLWPQGDVRFLPPIKVLVRRDLHALELCGMRETTKKTGPERSAS